MPSSSTAKNKFGREIVFEEGTHSYYIDDPKGKIKFTSVTTFINRFFPPFEADKIAPFVAKKRGVTVQEILKEWKEISAEACAFGTRVHTCCEDTINGIELRHKPNNDKEVAAYANAVKAANKVMSQFEIVGAEKLIFDEKYKLSGTIDLLARAPKNKNAYCIIDWKTNKKIDSTSKYNKFAFAPIEELPDCELSHYGLQLTLYGHILKSGGYIPMDAIVKYLLVHITESGINYIPVTGYEKYVEAMLKTL